MISRPYSELTKIQRYGKNNTAFPTAMEFEYTYPETNGFKPSFESTGVGVGRDSVRQTASDHMAQYIATQLYDYNGDGFVEYGCDALGGADNPATESFEFEALDTGAPCSYGDAFSYFAPRDAISVYFPPDSGLPGGYNRFQVADMVDMDGDGRVDRLEVRECAASNPGLEWCWHRNNGAGFDPPVYWPTPGVNFGNAGYFYDGHGLPHVLTSVHMGFTEDFDETRARRTTSMILDLNGDGLPDFYSVQQASFNNGAGFDPAVPWTLPESAHDALAEIRPLDVNAMQRTVADMNGDGLPDLITNYKDFGNIQAFLNVGTGWIETSNAFEGFGRVEEEATGMIPAGAQTPGVSATISTLIDMNADGLPDFVKSNLYPCPSGSCPVDPNAEHWQVYYSGGGGGWVPWNIPGFFHVVSFPPGIQNGLPYSIREGFTDPLDYHISYSTSKAEPVDLSGDGLPDYVSFSGSLPPTIWEHPGPMGLLKKVTNELGGTTEIEYEPLTHAAKKATVAAQLQMPNAPSTDEGLGAASAVVSRAQAGRWVVTSVKVFDGRGGAETDLEESLAYAEPRFDFERRENMGFRLVESKDAGSVLTRSLFHQADDLRGKLQAQETIDGTGALLASSVTTWTALAQKAMTSSGPGTADVGGSWHVVPTTEVRTIYDPTNVALSQSLTTVRELVLSPTLVR